jgi:hypothetical protein
MKIKSKRAEIAKKQAAALKGLQPLTLPQFLAQGQERSRQQRAVPPTRAKLVEQA